MQTDQYNIEMTKENPLQLLNMRNDLKCRYIITPKKVEFL